MIRLAVIVLAVVVCAPTRAQDARSHYRVDTLGFDEDAPLEVGALAVLRDRSLLVGTRLGDVYRFPDPFTDDFTAPDRTLWASGLAQPLGFLELDGWIYTTQRGELTRIRDTDGDGRADDFELVCDDWEISGNYHEYNFGPRRTPDGKLWVTLNKPFGREPYGKAHWRGWAVRIDPTTGSMEPIATGLRSPAGVEVSPTGEVFYTDNQGEWCNASKLAHIEYGEFHGHPHGLHSKDLAGEPFASIVSPKSGVFMKDLATTLPQFKMPAVWFPYDKMGKSPSGMAWDPSEGRFGPFAGQLFVGDQHHASIMRVCLERVDGHWQGACFPFLDGLDCGVTRVAFGHDGSLFVGMTNSGWGSKGTRPWGLHRIRWRGTTPFEVHTVRATSNGFELRLTDDVDETTATDPANYDLESYTYRLRKDYGGPEELRETLAVRVESVDGARVRIAVEPFRAGFVHEFRLDRLRSAGGAPLWHPRAYYTLVKIPR